MIESTLHTIKDCNDNSHLRVTVDYPEDLELIKNILAELHNKDLNHQSISSFLNANQETTELNKNFKRNEALPELD